MIFPEQRMDLPGVGVLKKMLSWAGQGGARKIVIPKVRGLTSSKLILMLHASPSLEHLDLGDLPSDVTFPSEEKLYKRLKHVSFSFFGYSDRISIDVPGGFPQIFLQDAASSLEHLTIAGEIPQLWCGELPSVPLLPELKTLRMAMTVASPLSFSIVCLPCLESHSEKLWRLFFSTSSSCRYMWRVRGRESKKN